MGVKTELWMFGGNLAPFVGTAKGHAVPRMCDVLIILQDRIIGTIEHSKVMLDLVEIKVVNIYPEFLGSPC